jgi:spectinomycin phosphotransferase
VREAPADVSVADVSDTIERHWGLSVDAGEHLPLGFGAHHWKLTVGALDFFATLDGLGPRHTAQSLERAYATAAALAGTGLEFVAASVATTVGGYTAPLGTGRLGLVRWIEGEVAGSGSVGDARLANANAGVLARLHAAVPPDGIPQWRPRVDATFAGALRARCGTGWDTGPHGEAARGAVAAKLADVDRWTSRYLDLAARAATTAWVVTHGEPHTGNQLVTASGLVFVDWESVALAPRERDLRTLVDSGFAHLVGPEWAGIELFDLEWRLDEISEYVRWFSSPHGGTASDRVALDGLRHELERPEWTATDPAARPR